MDGTQNLNGRISRLEEKSGQRRKGIEVVIIIHEPPAGTNQIPKVVVVGAHSKEEEEQIRAKVIEKWRIKNEGKEHTE
jgi:hypothetical protein